MSFPSSSGYLFVSDQGQVFWSAKEPTDADYAFAEVGMLVIIRLQDQQYFAGRRRWQPVNSTRLVHPEEDGLRFGPFHSMSESADTSNTAPTLPIHRFRLS